jgi:hypothetical protein
MGSTRDEKMALSEMANYLLAVQWGSEDASLLIISDSGDSSRGDTGTRLTYARAGK